MLTNVYYYNFYKPYIFRTGESDDLSAGPRQEKMAGKRQSAVYLKVLLNKSLKQDVVDYARGISNSVIGTKESIKYLVHDMTGFNNNIHRYGVENAMGRIKYDLEEFVESYNSSVQFLSAQKHSHSLRGFSERLEDIVAVNAQSLSKLGVTRDKDGKLSLNEPVFDALDESRLKAAISGTLGMFNDMYLDIGGILEEPLKEHMDFRGHGYYYNYKLGRIENDTFKIIESGMIVDRAV